VTGDVCCNVLLRRVIAELEAGQRVVQRTRIEVAVEADGGEVEEDGLHRGEWIVIGGWWIVEDGPAVGKRGARVDVGAKR